MNYDGFLLDALLKKNMMNKPEKLLENRKFIENHSGHAPDLHNM